jgi:hypothetical protein
MVNIGYKTPWVKMWWQEYQMYIQAQTTALYYPGFSNMYDLNDPDMYIWNPVCSDSWR